MQLQDVKVIKGYLLTDLIGVGGFGAVYRAQQPIVDREVAIKAILPEYANHPEFIRRFEAEAQLIARLEHPHIVPLYDYWREPDGAYLVMRLLRGGNLHERLALEGAWSLEAAARLLDQVAAALDAAHRRGIVHQDIKPGNILLDEDSNCYLADFGIAKNLLDVQEMLHKGPRIGTPLFMAPEQFSPEGVVTPQTDIYSLGIVLYATLTGRVPFAHAETTMIIRSHLNDPLPPVQFARPELPHEINNVLRCATAKEPQARYESALAMAADFRQIVPGLATLPIPPTSIPAPAADMPTDASTIVLQGHALELQNPYKGLRAFQEADASDFFGREALTARLLRRLQDPDRAGRFLAVVGPSGSGKSSVVQAGVIPLLRQGYVSGSARWFIVRMQPGADPFAELETALLRIALAPPPDMSARLRGSIEGLAGIVGQILPDDDSDLLLVIDQFEEIFTQTADETIRARFLKSLHHAVTAPDCRLHAIITLRADFYDRPLLYPDFGNLIREQTEVVLPMNASELEQAILRPAERAGLSIEPVLARALVDDVIEQPGALPLLQYTLTDLFERRQNTTLTYAAYQEAGGISGTLARRADELYEQLPPPRQKLARQLLLRLVAVSEGTEATRQRVKWGALLSLVSEPERPVIREILDLFGRNRLLTFDHDPQTREPTVEVAHEALIREWDRLQGWLEENRADLLTQRRLATAILEWNNAGRDPSYLATGNRLAQFEAWRASTSLTLNADEIAYLDASVALRRRAANRLRLFIAALILFALVSLGLAKFAFDQQAATAQQARISRSRELAATAITSRAALDLSLLLSLEALRSADTFEARSSLLTGLQAQPQLITFLHGHTDWVRDVAFSPDGRMLVSAGRDGTIRRWDVAARQPIDPPLTGHTDWINGLAFSPDGSLLASAGRDRTIRLWDAASGEPIGDPLVGHAAEVWAIAFSPDGAALVSGDAEGGLLLWNLTGTPTITRRLEGHTGAIYAVAFSPDGRLIASAGEEQTIRLWDAASGEALGDPLAAHANWVLALAFSPDGTRLASVGVDASVILWDAQTRQALGRLQNAHSGWIRDVTFSPDGARLATASMDGTLRLWEANSGLLTTTLNGHRDAVWSVAFSPDGSLLASGGQDNAVVLWASEPGQRLAHPVAIALPSAASIAFSPDGALAATATGQYLGSNESSAITLWQLANASPGSTPPSVTLPGHAEVVTVIAFSPDGTQLASGSVDQTVRLWAVTPDGAAAPVGEPMPGHASAVISLAFSPDGSRLASGDDDGMILLWDAATGAASGDPLQGHSDSVTALAFSPDGRRLASGSRDGQIVLWDTTDSRQIAAFPAHDTAVMTLTFSPDGQLLASGGRDNLVRLWDAASGQAIRPPLVGHAHWVLSAVFSPDGSTLATGSRDGGILLWDVGTGRPLGAALVGEGGWITALAFAADGQTLLAGSTTTAITRWDVGTAVWAEHACQIAGRNLNAEEWAQYLPGADYRATCGEAEPEQPG
ncbi:MAG: protein kinase [Anaerolineae bacterium]|nr:protein kinase [Anaerolineae bacterium]